MLVTHDPQQTFGFRHTKPLLPDVSNEHGRRDLGTPTLLDQSALAPWIDQTVGAFPTSADCETCAPFMNQIATLPLVSCHRMSLLRSPLKSPVSTIDQLAGEV